MKSVEEKEMSGETDLVSDLFHPAYNLGRNLVHILHSVLHKFHPSRLLADREASVSPSLEEV